jgi:hypothetical protein
MEGYKTGKLKITSDKLKSKNPCTGQTQHGFSTNTAGFVASFSCFTITLYGFRFFLRYNVTCPVARNGSQYLRLILYPLAMQDKSRNPINFSAHTKNSQKPLMSFIS